MACYRVIFTFIAVIVQLLNYLMWILLSRYVRNMGTNLALET